MPLCPGKVEVFQAVRPDNRMGFPNVGARGCFLSHFGILSHAARGAFPNILIMEDDLMISSVLAGAVETLICQLEKTAWGIVYFGHIETVPATGRPQLVSYDQPVVTTHFYAVNGPVIPRLVGYMEQVQEREPGDPLGGPMHLDGTLTMFRQANPDVLTLIAHPNLGQQRPSRSDIHCPWYERLPLVQQAADVTRVIRERLRA